MGDRLEPEGHLLAYGGSQVDVGLEAGVLGAGDGFGQFFPGGGAEDGPVTVADVVDDVFGDSEAACEGAVTLAGAALVFDEVGGGFNGVFAHAGVVILTDGAESHLVVVGGAESEAVGVWCGA
ncbi:hypothetical protein ACUY2L_06860 [Corynebacterium mastitidis]